MSLTFITSPAKTLDLSSNWKEKSLSPTTPQNIKQAIQIANQLKQKTPSQLQKILSVSDNITQLNFDRIKSWEKKHTKDNSKPALLMYDGAVYKQIEKNTFTKKQMEYAQSNLRAISGFYGLLKPYDLIQPYRLEMNNKIKIKGYKSLADYWKNSITQLLNQDIKENKAQVIISLASKEYSQTIDINKLSIPFITIDFKEERNGKLKTIPIYAKQARGVMINYAIKNNVTEVKELTKANINGYTFLKEENNHLIFTKK